MHEPEHLLPTLDPPPGGLSRLQQRIAEQRRPTHPAWQACWVWAAVVVPVLVLIVWAQQRIAKQQRTHALVEALDENLSPGLPTSGIRVANGAAIELPSGQANVRLYLVQSAQPEIRGQ